jgi:group I intron endonuclease
MIGIYKFTNKINGKIYIGQSRNIKSRWREHKFWYKKENTYFYNAINKYEWGNFDKEVLIEITDDNWTKQLLNFYETYFVFYYDTMNYQKGYNIKFPGADGKLSEEVKRKMSLAQKGHSVSKETRILMRIAALGRKQSQETINKRILKLKGKKRTEEQKERIRGKNNLLYGKTNGKEKKIICIETNKIYDSSRQAQEIFNKNSNHISECCLGQRKTWNKLHWEYV